MKAGAFRFAIKSNVPVIACMITMQDSDILGKDGYYVQEYTLHILGVIYPNAELSNKENMECMKAENERLLKEKYEEVYGIPLVYTTEEGNK